MNKIEGTLYDEKGNVMFCKCGKKAVAGIFGKEAFKLWCIDCYPSENFSYKLIYRAPNEK